MKLLLSILAMAMADRAFPANIRRFGGSIFEGSKKDFYDKYGWFSFPRTLWAVCTCVCMGLDSIIPMDETAQTVIALFFVFLWGVFATIDTLRSRK